MGSLSETTRTRPLTVASATLASAALFYAGTGLDSIGALTWLAPLPVLLLATRVHARVAAGAAFIAYLLGILNVADYYLRRIELPVPLVVGLFVLTSAIFCLDTLAFRALARCGHGLLAVATFAGLWVGAEYVVSVALPFGANWSLAPTQAGVPVIVQIASATGIWGISFLVMGVPAAAAMLLTPGVRRPTQLRVAAAAVAVLVLTVTYGISRLGGTDTGDHRRVAVAAAPLHGEQPTVTSSAGQRLVEDDLAAIAATRRGTQLIVFPEKDLVVDDASLPQLTKKFGDAAQSHRVDVVLGIELRSASSVRNVAMVFPAGGGTPTNYDKRYLVAGLEDDFTAGRRRVVVPGSSGQVGVAICADLGHPSLGRAYARAGARLMAVPALDFTVDARSQSRVQDLRGIENGMSIARSSRLGYLTLIDPEGRLLAQRTADDDSSTVMISADLSISTRTTLYTRWGDWFAWLCLLVGASGVGQILRQGRATAKTLAKGKTVPHGSRG